MGLDEVDLQVAALRVVVDAQVELADACAVLGSIDDDRSSLSRVQVELERSQRAAGMEINEPKAMESSRESTLGVQRWRCMRHYAVEARVEVD